MLVLKTNLDFLLLDFFVEPHGDKLGKRISFAAGDGFQQKEN
jgi:hypothetical protein